MTPNVLHFLGVKDKNRTIRIDMCKTKDHKKKRNKNIFNKLRKEELVKTKEHKRKEGTYRTGMNMDDDEDLQPPAGKKKARTTNPQAVCKHCGLQGGHSRITNKKCLHYKRPQVQPTGNVPTVWQGCRPIWRHWIPMTKPKTWISMKGYRHCYWPQHIKSPQVQQLRIPTNIIMVRMKTFKF
jgi:hypothetical protein